MEKYLIQAFIVILIYSIFAFGFMVRKLKRVSFIIDAKNKDKNKGLSWYKEKITEQALDMRFKQTLSSSTHLVFRPWGLYRVFESNIIIELTPYDIKLTCTRMMMRIILDYLELTYEDEQND